MNTNQLLTNETLHKKTIKGHAYWYLRETEWKTGKSRVIWQKYLGTVEKIKEVFVYFSGIPKERSYGLSWHVCVCIQSRINYLEKKFGWSSAGMKGKTRQNISFRMHLTIQVLSDLVRCLAADTGLNGFYKMGKVLPKWQIIR